MKTLLKNGNIVTDKIEKKNIMIENGFITDITDNSIDADSVLDCTGKYIVPGLIDMHVHLREPGQEYKEDLYSGAETAIYGGVTTICCMANTSPVIDNSALVGWIKRRSMEIGLANIIPFATVTKGMKGEELTEMGDLLNFGAAGFSDDGKGIASAEVMRRALEYSKYFNSFVSAHEEDLSLCNGGVAHEGKMSTAYGLKGIPSEAESVMVGRDIQLARLTGGHIHICHVSSLHSVKLIEQAKAAGINVTAEVTHNHLLFNEDICTSYCTNTKVNPPFRAEADRLALIDGLKRGIIDCIASDHAPHHKDDKFKEYDYAASGIIGLQTIIPFSLQLIAEGKITWNDFVRVTSTRPAEILGLTGHGKLQKGYLADITVIDPDIEYIFDENISKSKSFNTPVWGKKLKGKAVNVFKSGQQLI